MNRLKVLILFFLFFFQKTGFSQPDQDLENWNPGYLVTRDEDTLYGPIMVNFGSDLIQLNEENTIKTFGANQIIMAYVKENDRDKDRYIYSFPFHPFSDFKPYKLFEMLFSGKSACLLAREMLVTETIPLYDNFTYRTYFSTRTKLVSDFFLMFPKEKVKALHNSKKELLVLMADKKDQIKSIISANKYSVSEKENLIQIVKEYNILKSL